ncbi:MAG: hypothetical protein HUU20_17005 [Pirellulales bacterium]|nr:hypothetical protein [Pirellulales bacterium]
MFPTLRLRGVAVCTLAVSMATLAANAVGSGTALAAESDPKAKTIALDQGFLAPPDPYKPWAYWWWLKANVTRQSITRDLEEMKKQGIGGLLMFDARGYHEDHVPPPESSMDFMGPEWRRMLKFGMEEAGRVGLEMSVNLSICAGALKGPWPVGDDAPKKLVWATAEVAGPGQFHGELPREDWGRFWDVAVIAARHSDSAKKGSGKAAVVEVVDLTGKVVAGKQLAWDVPAGQWTLIRFACVPMEGHEYDVDILDPKAVEGHFNRMGRALLEDAGPLAGKTLTHFYSVSWEGAAPTWSLGLEREFRKYRGYEIRRYMPVLTGLTVEDADVSERFLVDYHKTLSDCFMNHFYGKLRDLCHEAGLKWHSESGGPWDRKIPSFQNADQLAFLARNDMPQGEFWWPKRGLNRPPAITAHIYGKQRAAVEAFTHMRKHWSAYPATLKPEADAAFCDGANHFIWHTFAASPPEFGLPGIVYFAGTHLNPNVTWFKHSGAFLAYLARCQFLLQQGKFVAEVCSYTGDSPYLHWGRGEKWSQEPSLVLGKGYAFDLVNTEVLLERMSVRSGDLVLPDGMRYRMLVVDLASDAAPPQALKKIAELARAGATIVLGRDRPKRAPGLENYPACDEEVRRLAGELWGDAGGQASVRSFGSGRIIAATPIDEALKQAGIAQDFAGPWDYIHRRVGDAEIYFVAGAGEAECTFRVSGKEPEFWDPATGRIRDAVCYRTSEDGRTIVPIALPENGSTFVVFRREAEKRHLVAMSAPAGAVEIAGRSEGGARVRVWQNGSYAFETSAKKAGQLKVEGIAQARPVAGSCEVRFAPGWGAPESISFEELIPWNEHPDEAIRYFSGTATYRNTFELDASQATGLVRLQLGEVCQIAEIRVNGRPLGVVWTAPWSVDLTGAVKPGKNEMEIDVTNLWANRLIGDARLPEEKRRTKTNLQLHRGPAKLRPFQGYTSEDPLMRSGLVGEVTLEFGQERLAD